MQIFKMIKLKILEEDSIGRIRTNDPLIITLTLYRLSYEGEVAHRLENPESHQFFCPLRQIFKIRPFFHKSQPIKFRILNRGTYQTFGHCTMCPDDYGPKTANGREFYNRQQVRFGP